MVNLWFFGFIIFYNLHCRNSEQRYSVKKGVLRNFEKIYMKTPVPEAQRPATLLKMRLWHRCFPVNFFEISKNTFFTEHLWTTAFDIAKPNLTLELDFEKLSFLYWAIYYCILRWSYNNRAKKLLQLKSANCFSISFIKFARWDRVCFR